MDIKTEIWTPVMCKCTNHRRADEDRRNEDDPKSTEQNAENAGKQKNKGQSQHKKHAGEEQNAISQPDKRSNQVDGNVEDGDGRRISSERRETEKARERKRNERFHKWKVD